MTQAVKVYQIADALGLDYDIVVAKIKALGHQVNNKMSKVDGVLAEQIKSSLLKERQQDWIEVEISPGVRKRVRKNPPASAPAPSTTAPTRAEPSVAREEVVPAREERAATPTVTESPAAVVSEPTSVPAAVETVETPAAPAVAAATETTPAPTQTNVTEPVAATVEPVVVAPVVAPAVVVSEPVHEPPAATVVEPVAPVAAPVATPAVEPTPAPVESEPATPVAATPAQAEPVAAVAEPVAPVAVAPVAAVEPQETKPVEPVQTVTEPVPAPIAALPPIAAVVEPVVATPVSMPAPTPSTAPSPPHARSSESTPPSRGHESRASSSRTYQAPVTPSVPPPAGSDRPSVAPPKPRTGIAVYNPETKTIDYIPSSPRRLIDASASIPKPTSGRPNMRPNAPQQQNTRPNTPSMPPRGTISNVRRQVPPPTSMGPRPAATATPSAQKRVVKIEGQIVLNELARRMSVKASEVLIKLISMGMTGVNINSLLDSDTAKLLAQEFGYEVEDVAVSEDAALKAILPEFKDNTEDFVTRAPVVTVMGHVDHGKTTLLDAILGMRVAEGEAGGITQKVSAYRVETKKGPVVFFDTPGHEAFTKLRARGAKTTDVAVLVVAADDGVMPTTREAIAHVRNANVPIIVALNKIDKPDANPDKVVDQLMGAGVVPEKWNGNNYGGEELFVKVSAKQRLGLEELLENLALQSEILQLQCNPKRPGRGTVFDATLDKGRGVVARVLVQDGTIRAGDVVIAGAAYGKIRAMFDDRGKAITKAGPSTPVEILGLNEVPPAGEPIHVVKGIKEAQVFAATRTKPETAKPSSVMPGRDAIEKILAEGGTISLGVIIKAEAQASVEALSKALGELSTDKVKVQTVYTGIGGITESDVNLAVASKAVILGFNVRPQGKTTSLAESEKVQIKLYNIIYEAVDDVKAMMLGQLKPTFTEKFLGKAEVREVFNITRVGTVAGCYVTDGTVKRAGRARLVRDSVQVWEGKLASLKRFKDDAKEVAAGYECGIALENYNDIKPRDVIEVFELEEKAAEL